MSAEYAGDGRGANLNKARHLISQLAHFEITSPRPEESVEWFTDVLGLQESGREGQSVYLRAWGEFFHHTLVVTEGAEPALVHIG
jgi:catechol 2,3-dioxygenase